MGISIYDRFFKHNGFLPIRIFDGSKSLLHRKQYLLWTTMEDTKPTSATTAALVERIGRVCRHHVFWLQDEGSALHESSSMRGRLRAPVRTASSDQMVRAYLNRVYTVLDKLRSS